METITTTVDWLSYTVQELPEGIPHLFPDFVHDLSRVPCQPKFGYARAYTLEFGIVVMCEGATERMGAHYIYSGSTLQRMLMVGIEPIDVVRWHSGRGHKPTRIDMAIDVMHSPTLMGDIHAAISAKEFTTSAKKVSETKSLVGTGQTLYFGARTSPLFLRIYDKGAEQEVSFSWTRIETECKDAKARAVEYLLLHSDQIPIYQTAVTLARKLFDCEQPSWKRAMNAESVELGQPKANESDTEKWLMESVALCLAKYHVKNLDKNILERFWNVTMQHVIDLKQNGG